VPYPKITFTVTENRDCPLYEHGQRFHLSGVGLAMESDAGASLITTAVFQVDGRRPSCKTLCADLTRLLIRYERVDRIPRCLISCSGCTGSIELEYTVPLLPPADATTDLVSEEVLQTLADFPFFRAIDRTELEEVVRAFTLVKHPAGTVVLRQGEPGGEFYIIVSGRVRVLNESGLTITTLERGEVFGEMSLICEEHVGATVQTCEPSAFLAIDARHFHNILQKFPDLQLYFTRLLARRLSRANQGRADDQGSAITGRLEEIPPEALFQTLHANRKTGILTVTGLSRGTARFSLRQGGLIRARYRSTDGAEAFYAVLREKHGLFRFTPGLPPEELETPELGSFMRLLMTGIQRLDEEQAGVRDN